MAIGGEKKYLPRKSLPAGLPSGFISNVTVRNQFGKVLARPPPESQFANQERFRDGSASSTSPYGTRAPDLDMATAESVTKISGRKRNVSPKQQINPPFNRFAKSSSDQNLLRLALEPKARRIGLKKNSVQVSKNLTIKTRSPQSSALTKV